MKNAYKEIGSEFWEAPTAEVETKLFPAHTSWYLSGRVALTAILRDIGLSHAKKRVMLPSWCCESMVKPFVQNGYIVKFYNVYAKHGKLIIEYPSEDSFDIILVTGYFGYASDIDVPDYKKLIIKDETHSVFSQKRGGADYYYGSLRKWAFFATGGFAWKKSGRLSNAQNTYDEYIKARRFAAFKKGQYMAGEIKEKEHLQFFGDAEKMLDVCNGVYSADKADIDNALILDTNLIKTKRRENAKYLLKSLNEITVFKNIGENDCPLFVPVLVKNRDELRDMLKKNDIYCPIHWGKPYALDFNDEVENFYRSELSLVCDQRYDLDHMEKMVNIVKAVARPC